MNKPTRVTIVGFDHALSSAICGAMDLFALAGISWQRIHRQPLVPKFKVQVASMHGAPFTCTNQLSIQPHLSINEVENTDLLLIPTIGGSIERVLADNGPLLMHIRRLVKLGATVASNCTGAFLLAEAGILNNKVATTHWGYAEQFRQRYPSVNLQVDNIFTMQDKVFCAGGGLAWTTLSQALIEQFCGKQVANELAQSHVLNMHQYQHPLFISHHLRTNHQDQSIRAIQSYIDNHFSTPITIELLADKAAMTPRTFLRRFKQASGHSPSQYIQLVRIEQAQKLLETQNWAVDKIVQQVGYDDTSSFSRLFKRHTGLSPSQYRAKYSPTQ